MEKPPPSPQGSATHARLASELHALRDAATRLSLALEDYRFLVVSVQQPGPPEEVVELLAKLKSVSSK